MPAPMLALLRVYMKFPPTRKLLPKLIPLPGPLRLLGLMLPVILVIAVVVVVVVLFVL